MTVEEWNGGFRDEIQCPHCGMVDYEFTDYPKGLREDGDTADTECFGCGGAMAVTVSVSYSYATEPRTVAGRAPCNAADATAPNGPGLLKSTDSQPVLAAPGEEPTDG